MQRQSLKRNIHLGMAIYQGFQAIKNPQNTQAVLNFAETLENLAQPQDLKKLEKELLKSRQAVQAIKKRWRLGAVDLKKMASFPQGTLGREFVTHLEKNKIRLEELTPQPVHDDLSYLVAHLYETHDIWHTVTGFDASIEGELGLAAFAAAQFPSQFNYFLLAGGLIHTALYDFEERFLRMNLITQGWQMGKKAKPFFGVQWNHKWNEPLVKIRKELNTI